MANCADSPRGIPGLLLVEGGVHGRPQPVPKDVPREGVSIERHLCHPSDRANREPRGPCSVIDGTPHPKRRAVSIGDGCRAAQSDNPQGRNDRFGSVPAGAVVGEDVAPATLAGGNPATYCANARLGRSESEPRSNLRQDGRRHHVAGRVRLGVRLHRGRTNRLGGTSCVVGGLT